MPYILFEILRMICLVKNMLLSSALKIPNFKNLVRFVLIPLYDLFFL